LVAQENEKQHSSLYKKKNVTKQRAIPLTAKISRTQRAVTIKSFFMQNMLRGAVERV
jgi:hypothetical protein